MQLLNPEMDLPKMDEYSRSFVASGRHVRVFIQKKAGKQMEQVSSITNFEISQFFEEIIQELIKTTICSKLPYLDVYFQTDLEAKDLLNPSQLVMHNQTFMSVNKKEFENGKLIVHVNIAYFMIADILGKSNDAMIEESAEAVFHEMVHLLHFFENKKLFTQSKKRHKKAERIIERIEEDLQKANSPVTNIQKCVLVFFMYLDETLGGMKDEILSEGVATFISGFKDEKLCKETSDIIYKNAVSSMDKFMELINSVESILHIETWKSEKISKILKNAQFGMHDFDHYSFFCLIGKHMFYTVFYSAYLKGKQSFDDLLKYDFKKLSEEYLKACSELGYTPLISLSGKSRLQLRESIGRINQERKRVLKDLKETAV